MSSVVVEGSNSYFMGAKAFLYNEDNDTASEWASKHIRNNKALKWVLGKYVEADNANSNKQYWTLDDLQLAKPTIDYAPLNMLHQRRYIVGTYVAAEMMYPVSDQENSYSVNPYIEALAAFWKYYFPEELSLVEKAHDEGSLFFSMECVSKTITFVHPDGSEYEFPYAGPRDESYEGKDTSDAIRRLNEPHFLGGALIIPPERPGWRGATIEELSSLIKEKEEEAQKVYEMVSQESPHLNPEKWEELMLQIMLEVENSYFSKKKKSPKQLAQSFLKKNLKKY
jgi:hypothetical protein